MTYRPFAVDPNWNSGELECDEYEITVPIYDSEGEVKIAEVDILIAILDECLMAFKNDIEITNMKDWFRDGIENELMEQGVKWRHWDSMGSYRKQMRKNTYHGILSPESKKRIKEAQEESKRKFEETQRKFK